MLEKCDWTHSPLSDFNALPAKARPIRDAKPQRNAWFEVQQKLSTLLETVGEELREARKSKFLPGLDISKSGAKAPRTFRP